MLDSEVGNTSSDLFYERTWNHFSECSLAIEIITRFPKDFENYIQNLQVVNSAGVKFLQYQAIVNTEVHQKSGTIQKRLFPIKSPMTEFK